MKDRPILFSAPMVRAILDGRKTQTRRVVKPQPVRVADTTILEWRGGLFQPDRLPTNSNMLAHCPYGQPGDRLWVREIHSIGVDGSGNYILASTLAGYPKNYLWGDTPIKHPEAPEGSEGWCLEWKRRPSIHMPRWASRITLEITGVRVERLQDIGDEDSLEEGIYPTATGLYPGSPKAAYQKLWEQINGPGSWDSNPWVWVVEFKKVGAA